MPSAITSELAWFPRSSSTPSGHAWIRNALLNQAEACPMVSDNTALVVQIDMFGSRSPRSRTAGLGGDAAARGRRQCLLPSTSAANGNGSSLASGARRQRRPDASNNEANERVLGSSPERRPPRPRRDGVGRQQRPSTADATCNVKHRQTAAGGAAPWMSAAGSKDTVAGSVGNAAAARRVEVRS